MSKIAKLVLVLSIVANTVAVFSVSNTTSANQPSKKDYSKSSIASIEEKVEMMTSDEYSFDANTVIVKYKTDNINSFNVDKSQNPLKVFGIDTVQVNTEELKSFSNISKYDFTAEPINIADTVEERDAVRARIMELMNDTSVEYAEPNYIRYTQAWSSTSTIATPGDFNATTHWYYEGSNLREMWRDQNCQSGGALCGGDSNIIVAIIDSGVAYGPFDDTDSDGSGTADYSFSQYILGISGGKNYSAVSGEYDGMNLYVNSGEIPNNGIDDDCNDVIDDYNGIDTYGYNRIYEHPYYTSINFRTCNSGTPVDYGNESNGDLWKMGHPIDTYGHGSFVAGNIAGEVDNGGSFVSPAFNVTVMPIAANIHYTNSFRTTDILDGVAYSGFYGADIINMSLGGAGYSQSEDDFYTFITEYYGTTIIAASGNDGSAVNYPAAYPAVIAVGATNSDDTKTSYSSYGNNIDLVAYVGSGNTNGTAAYQDTLGCYPSCNSSSTYNSVAGRYSIGTSFAAPQVAAAAAIYKSNNPSASRDEIRAALLSSTRDINTAGFDIQTGVGVLDFEKIQNHEAGNIVISQTGDVTQTIEGKTTDTFSVVLGSAPASNVVINITYDNVEISLDKTQLTFTTGNWSTPQVVTVSSLDDAVSNNNRISDVTFEVNSTDISFENYYIEPVGVQIIDTIPLYRFRNFKFGGHFFTASSYEYNFVVPTYYTDRYASEGIAFDVFEYNETTDRCVAGEVIHRFNNPVINKYFYGTEDEMNYILSTPSLSNWIYERKAFCLYTTDGVGRKPVHRYRSEYFQSHFYTANPAELNYINNDPFLSSVWIYEGIKFYIPE